MARHALAYLFLAGGVAIAEAKLAFYTACACFRTGHTFPEVLGYSLSHQPGAAYYQTASLVLASCHTTIVVVVRTIARRLACAEARGTRVRVTAEVGAS